MLSSGGGGVCVVIVPHLWSVWCFVTCFSTGDLCLWRAGFVWDSAFGVFVSSFISVHSFVCHCHPSCLFVCAFAILFLYLTHFRVTGHIASSSGLYTGTVM